MMPRVDDVGRVPVDELLARLDREFQQRRAVARTAMEQLERPAGDERVFQLASVEQALERARAMLGRASEIALLDLFPEVAPHIIESMTAAAGRGVNVVAKIYAPIDAEARSGIEWIPCVDSEVVFSSWPGQQLTVVTRRHRASSRAVRYRHVARAPSRLERQRVSLLPPAQPRGQRTRVVGTV